MTKGEGVLMRLARRELSPAVAERWVGLLRPSLLLRAAYEDEPLVGQLGGVPELPDGFAWPYWDGYGPLTFVAEIDCGQLPSVTLSMPRTGRLLFFLADGLADGQGISGDPLLAGPGDPENRNAVRVVYIPVGTPVTVRDAPAGIEPYDLVELAGELFTTGPTWNSPVFREAIADLDNATRAFMDDWSNHDVFGNALWEVMPEHPRHWIGGHAVPIQDAVEYEVAYDQLGGVVPYGDPALHKEALRWTLLAQFDSDDQAGMRWGDCGRLYWLIRPKDLAARRFERASFTWQCS